MKVLSFPSKPRLKHLLVIATPMILSMLSENMIGLVDALMVGRLGTAPLAAVGISGFLYFISFSILLGITSGIQAVSAWRYGEQRFHIMGQALNTGIMMAYGVAIPVFLLFTFFAPQVLGFVTSDPNVLREAIPFFKWRVTGILFLAITLSFQGYWNGTSKGHYYFGMLVIGHSSNAFLNYCLIFGKFGFPEFGTAGAGMASAFSLVLGVLYCLFFGLKEELKHGFLKILPDRHTIYALTKVSVPMSIEKLFMAFGLTLLYKIMGLISTQAVAGSYVIIQLLLLGILPAIGFGLGATTLVGQALGKDDIQDAINWAWDTVKVGIVYALFVSTLLFIFAPQLIGFFIVDDPETVRITIPALRIFSCVITLEAVGRILMGALVGAGDSKSVMLFATGGMYLLFLPLALFFGPYLGWGLAGSWFGDSLYQIVFCAMFVVLWKRGRWKRAKCD